jgi:hypothetical protein
MSRANVELVRRIYEDGLLDGDPERVVHEFGTEWGRDLRAALEAAGLRV